MMNNDDWLLEKERERAVPIILHTTLLDGKISSSNDELESLIEEENSWDDGDIFDMLFAKSVIFASLCLAEIKPYCSKTSFLCT